MFSSVSQPWIIRFRWNLVRRRALCFQEWLPDEKLEFDKFKIADSAILKIVYQLHFSTIVNAWLKRNMIYSRIICWQRLCHLNSRHWKFNFSGLRIFVLSMFNWHKFKIFQIQNGGQPLHQNKTFFRYISAWLWVTQNLEKEAELHSEIS